MKINTAVINQLIWDLDDLNAQLESAMLQQTNEIEGLQDSIDIPSLNITISELNSTFDLQYDIIVNSIYTVTQFLKEQLSSYVTLTDEVIAQINAFNSRISNSVQNCNNNFDFDVIFRTSNEHTGNRFQTGRG